MLTHVTGKVTHLKVLLDLGDEVTVERYMVVPAAPKMIGSFDCLVRCFDFYQFLIPLLFKCLFSPFLNLQSGHGPGAFEESQVIDNQRNRTAVSRTQNISHANMSDRAFERMCETGEVPDQDARPKKRKASKEDSGKKGKKSFVEEEDEEEYEDDDEEEEAPKSDRKSRHGSVGKSDVKTPSKGKSSVSKRVQESNGDVDSDGDDELIEMRNTPSSTRRSRGR